MPPQACRFYLAGNCRFGDNCKFDHPGAGRQQQVQQQYPRSNGSYQRGPEPQRANPFDVQAPAARPSDRGGAYRPAPAQLSNYTISREVLYNDLANERPQWLLSAYGPGRNEPTQLWGGYPREQSFEEMRFMVETAPDRGQMLSQFGALWTQAEADIQKVLADTDGALAHLAAGGRQHPNRRDICDQNSLPSPTPGVFVRREAQSPAANPFGQPTPSPFAAAKEAPTASPFGPPPNPFDSGFGGKPPQNPFAAAAPPAPSGVRQNPFAPSSAPPPAAAPNPFGPAPGIAQQPGPANPFDRQPANAFSAAPGGGGGVFARQPQSNAFGGAPQNINAGPAPNPFGPAPGSGPLRLNPFGAPAAPSAFGQQAQPPQQSAPFGAAQYPNPAFAGPPGPSSFVNGVPHGAGGDHSSNPHVVKDMTGRLLSFRGIPIEYVDDAPGYRGPDGAWTKLWFPNGAPTFKPEVVAGLVADGGTYDEAEMRQWRAFKERSVFGESTGGMPASPPPREFVEYDL